jgi:hypothetical protein
MAATMTVNVGAEVPKASNYWFLGVAGPVTATGFFLNSYGVRTGGAFSTAVPVGNGTSVPVRLSASPPADAVGAVVRFSGAVYFDIVGAAGASDDFKANYGRYPQYGASENKLVGQVGQ